VCEAGRDCTLFADTFSSSSIPCCEYDNVVYLTNNCMYMFGKIWLRDVDELEKLIGLLSISRYLKPRLPKREFEQPLIY
jgi:hypothetical protein